MFDRKWTLLLACLLTIPVVFMLSACSGSSSTTAGADVEPPGVELTPPAPAPPGWPMGLPEDSVQPWELREGAAVNALSEFNPGAQRWLESGGVSENGDALHLESGAPGNGSLSWAVYRMPMAGQQPGVVSTDVNLLRRGDGLISEYYIGLADYDRNAWDFHGPFKDNHVRLSLAAGNYVNTTGNLVVMIAAYDGAEFDIVGLGVNPVDPGDTTPPAAPTALGATSFAGALLLEWTAVAAADLAGYAVYYSDADFTDPHAPGVHSLGYLLGETECSLPVSELGPLSVSVKVAAVDISGNMGGLSPLAVGTPLTGEPPEVVLVTDTCGGTRDVMATLYASGADEYDWDLDGDGTIDIGGDTTGTQTAQTGQTGVIRPRVYGNAGGGTARACGSVSLVVTGNTRPVAQALAFPQYGPAPLTTTLEGYGEDFDDGDMITDYSWDIDGDGVFDTSHPTNPNAAGQVYPTPGVYNAKLRVTDMHGAWDIDTVAVHVFNPENDPPVASFTPSTSTGGIGTIVSFDASASSDPGPVPGNGIVRYHWDFGNGYYERFTTGPVTNYTYTAAGVYNVVLMVEDTHGATADTTVQITIVNTAPTANLTADHLRGHAPHRVAFDASTSTDPEGNIVRYDWDFNGDGIYDSFGSSPQVTHTYQKPGVHLCQVLVTDAEGLTDTETAEITATGWHTTTVVSGRDCWITCDGANIDGHPALIYLNTTPFPVRVEYIRALDAYGQEWGNPVNLVDSSAYLGQRLCLEDIGGNPAVLYDDDTGILKYIRATDATGGTWGTAVTVDTNPNRMEMGDLEMVNGRPATISIDRATWDIIYTRANDATGSSWPATGSVVPTTGDPGYLLELEVIEGWPCIAYQDDTGTDTYFVRATDTSGTGWGASVLITSNPVSSLSMHAYYDNFWDNPAITYSDSMNGGLHTRVATDSTGTTWNPEYTLDDHVDAGWVIAMTQVQGECAVAYANGPVGALKYIETMDPITAAEPILIDGTGDTGWACRLFEINGSVGIVYLEDDSSDLRYAQLIK